MLAALAGRSTTVDQVGSSAALNDWCALREGIAELASSKQPIFTEGKRTESIGVNRLAAAVEELVAAARTELSPALGSLRNNSLGQRRQGIFNVCSTVTGMVNEKNMSGLSNYKAKHFVDVLVLTACAGLSSFQLTPRDFCVTHGVYRMPEITCIGLLRIFPRAASDDEKRQGIRLLQKN